MLILYKFVYFTESNFNIDLVQKLKFKNNFYNKAILKYFFVKLNII